MFGIAVLNFAPFLLVVSLFGLVKNFAIQYPVAPNNHIFEDVIHVPSYAVGKLQDPHLESQLFFILHSQELGNLILMTNSK